MGDNLKRKCFKCGLSPRDDPDIKLYRFPRPGSTNMKRCEMWAKFCLPESSWSSVDFQQKLYSEHKMLCNKHFDESQFLNINEKKIAKDAVPCIDKNLSISNLSSSFGNNAESTSTTKSVLDSPQALQDITNIQHPQKDNSATVAATISSSYILSKKETVRKDSVQYNKCRKYVKTIWQLRKKIKRLKNRDTLNILNDNETVNKLSQKLTPSMSLLLQAQLRNFKKKYTGRRWTMEDKIIALRLYKRSATCYRLLRRLWCLPAPSTLKNLLAQFNLHVGINNKVFESLKKHVEKQQPSDNEYVLIFDEMSIRKHLWYNKREDKIEGYQDHGSIHDRTQQEATYALVFMVSGIRKKIKQPVAYYLSSSYVTGDRLAVLIKEVLHKCFEVKINISAMVCDMDGVNQKALRILGANKEKPYFNFENNEVVTLFDPPHLLKCFRNLLIKYNLKCTSNKTQGIAKWDHIREFYKVDSMNTNFVFAPKLKKEHLNPNNKQKMKVKLAAQVMSHSVAAGIFAKVSQGELIPEAVITAEVVSKIDKLFDCMNSDSSDLRGGKPHATNMHDNSRHLNYFKEILLFFENIEFIGCQRLPPSILGWTWSINAIIKLYQNLKMKHKIKSLATRRLQQDPLENLFGCVRANCGANCNPNVGQFVAAIKTAILSNLAHITYGNCEQDNYHTIMQTYKDILSKTAATDTCTSHNPKAESPLVSQNPEAENPLVLQMLNSICETDFEASLSNTGEIQACAYVCGFLLKNIKKCNLCSRMLHSSNNEDLQLFMFMHFKEYDDIQKKLNYASAELIKCVDKCATVCNNFFILSSYSLNLKKMVVQKCKNQVDFSFLKKCHIHFEENVSFIISSVFHICVKRFCILKNREYAEAAHSAALKRKMNIIKHN